MKSASNLCSGGDAGNGGHVILEAADLKLFMLVEVDCRSGFPGKAGEYGRAGSGGSGGTGGPGGSGGRGGILA